MDLRPLFNRNVPRAAARLAATCLLLAGGVWPLGCAVQPLRLGATPRAALPLPAEKAALFARPAEIPSPTFEVVRDLEYAVHERGRFVSAPVDRAASESEAPNPDAARPEAAEPEASSPVEVVFQLYRTKRGEGKRPLVCVMPILGGGYGIASMIAADLARHGFHAFFVERQERLFAGERSPRDLDRLVRQAVVNVRRVLDWADHDPGFGPGPRGLVGVSLGAILGTMLSAVEPRFGRTVLVMGGGDIPGIVCDSWEQPVHRFKIQRMDRLGLTTDEELKASFADLRLDPLQFAPYVETARVLQVVTLYDNRVPTRYQWKLWEALGKPKGLTIPSGHYTLALYKDATLAATRAFLAEGFAAEAVAEAAPSPVGGAATRAP